MARSTLSTKGKRGEKRKSTFATRASLGGGDSAVISTAQATAWAERIYNEDSTVFDEIESTPDPKISLNRAYQEAARKYLGTSWQQFLTTYGDQTASLVGAPESLGNYTFRQLDTYAKGQAEIVAKESAPKSIAAGAAERRQEVAKIRGRKRRQGKQRLKQV